MVIGIRSLALALMLAAGLAEAARAETYTFDQASISGNTGPITISFYIAVTDAAARNGFAISQSATFQEEPLQPETPLNLAGTGIEQIAFFAPFTGIQSSAPGGGSFAYIGGSFNLNPGWTVSLSGGPSGVTGGIQYMGFGDDLSIDIGQAPALTTITYVTDAPNACHEDPGCTFTGTMTVSGLPSAAPEPASLGLLAAGLVGLLLVASRRRPANALL